MNDFGEDYFERGLQTGQSAYENYRWIPELTIPLADQIANTCSIDYSDKILDYGCAMGFLVKAFRLLHYEAWGIDISEYAIKNAPSDINKYLYHWPMMPIRDLQTYLNFQKFDWVIAKDVFEHIQIDDLLLILDLFSKYIQNMFVVVPLGKDGKYNAETNNMDPSHVICEDINWWIKLFEDSGYEVVYSRTHMDYIKQSYNNIENAHGFFKLKSKMT